jgi:hypothetical protein
VLLEHGRLTFAGTAVETLNQMYALRPGEVAPGRVAAPLIGPLAIEEMRAEPVQGDTIESGRAVRIRLRYRADERLDVVWGFSLWTSDHWVCVTGEIGTMHHVLEPGTGELTCLIAHLPLVGGRYALRGAILDVGSHQPLALFGWQDAPAAFDVRAAPGAPSNVKMALNQLVSINVDWH